MGMTDFTVAAMDAAASGVIEVALIAILTASAAFSWACAAIAKRCGEIDGGDDA
jgi:hypothetical protein